MRWCLVLLVAMGCYNESDFIPSKTTGFCDLLVECTDPAVLAFDGITAETCEGTWGPIFRDESSGCKFRRRSAKACIQLLTAASCPSEGPVDLPDICGSVFYECPVDVPTIPVQETGQ